MRVARRAGIRHAASATKVSKTATLANVTGSAGLTLRRRLAIARASAHAATNPAQTPTPINCKPCQQTSFRMSFLLAPLTSPKKS